jgi:hypothetical protein
MFEDRHDPQLPELNNKNIERTSSLSPSENSPMKDARGIDGPVCHPQGPSSFGSAEREALCSKMPSLANKHRP